MAKGKSYNPSPRTASGLGKQAARYKGQTTPSKWNGPAGSGGSPSTSPGANKAHNQTAGDGGTKF